MRDSITNMLINGKSDFKLYSRGYKAKENILIRTKKLTISTKTHNTIADE